MEALHILEEKIARLIESKKKDRELVAELTRENTTLRHECEKLKESVEKMEDAFLAYGKNEAAASQERMQAKLAVDDLISSIDALIEGDSVS